MFTRLRHLILYLKLYWNHLVFWTIPTLPETYYAKIGSIYFKLGRYKKAVSKFEKSESSHNNDKIFSKYNWYYLGRSYLYLGNYKNALFYLNKYLTLNPRDDFARFIVGASYDALNQPEMAVGALQEALKTADDHIELYLGIAKSLKDMGRNDEALEYLRRAETKFVDPTVKAILSSMCNWVEGNNEIAISILKNFIAGMNNAARASKTVSRADIYIMLSRVQKDTKDMSGALTTLETAHAQYPNDPMIMNDLAMAYAEHEKNLDNAERLIINALEHQPENSFYLDTKAWILHKMGKSVDAKRVIQESLKLNPECKETLEHLRSIQESIR